MTDSLLTDGDLERLAALAGILLPARGKMPAPHDIVTFRDLLAKTATASGLSRDEVQAAMATMPPRLEWESVQQFATEHPQHFENLALLASGAYVMAPLVLERLGFPEDRRNPAGPLDAADEYETGILEPVIRRGSCFRDPRNSGAA